MQFFGKMLLMLWVGLLATGCATAPHALKARLAEDTAGSDEITVHIVQEVCEKAAKDGDTWWSARERDVDPIVMAEITAYAGMLERYYRRQLAWNSHDVQAAHLAQFFGVCAERYRRPNDLRPERKRRHA